MEIEITEAGKASDALEALRDKKLKLIGNLVHDSVPVSKNEVRAAIGLPVAFEFRIGSMHADSFQVSGQAFTSLHVLPPSMFCDTKSETTHRGPGLSVPLWTRSAVRLVGSQCFYHCFLYRFVTA